MSTQQQALIMDTILATRRALKRNAYDSDSDSSIDQNTNRGNKLKRRARFVRQGRLASSMGPAAYQQVAELGGYQRAIINPNPPLIDEDGYDIESDDDEEQVQEAVASAMEDNPYSSIHLEQILAPLTAVTDLPSHPTLSRPFTSSALTELVGQARTLMQKENAALWKAKPLLTRLVGDSTWAPCGLMTAPDDSDALLFTDTVSFFNRPAPAAAPSLNDGSRAAQENTSTEPGYRGPDSEEAVARPTEKTDQNKTDRATVDGETLPDATAERNAENEGGEESGQDKPAEHGPRANGNHDHGNEGKEDDGQTEDIPKKADPPGDTDVEMGEAPGAEPPPGGTGTAPHATASPAAARPGTGPASAAGRRSPTPEEPFIHPLFRLPAAAHPDRDVGLPEHEAEEVRRLLLLYVQKQEEICRGTKRLYEGLLRADRYRRTVWQWSKAEAHCGPNRDMSDGEDWYDRDEWGLEEDLKKGEDEVEEDTAQTQKRTRNRK
ncbi:hypothetical protein VTK26DRAFT_6974 [Humicola hyalothermophila]